MTAIAAAKELFIQIVGRDPEGIWSSAGRANLIGEHTDYNDGFVLPFAIAQRTDAALALRDDRRVRVASTFTDGVVEVSLDELDDLFPAHHDRVPEWATYPLGVAWAILQTTNTPVGAVSGFDLAIASEVPVGSGLSSSAAIEGAVSGALNDVWELGLTPVELAKVGRKAENEAVGAPTGIMDQMASMLGQPDAAIFLDCRSLETQVINLGLESAGLELLVINTKVQHSHSTGGYRERRESCEKGAAIMGVPALRDLSIDHLPRAEKLMDDVTFRRVRHIVTENQRVLDTVAKLAASGPLAIGELLLASHASMRDDFEISIAELDTAVEASVAAGAVGARMTGGGFGGSAIALIHAEDTVSVAEAVEKAFYDAGFTAPQVFPVYPSQGARRDS
ncbi:galactokinase [Microbacterium endophyticum]|uniref:Galactokinase n=1 Tax=Microbacterium endophyticum TaxID=1526412 RepID=A0A7W4YN73_9MICO|nr:galactokinase [Microbacterium endophyticum]MBB2975862.1 galactokinase [Microbacterium endophyticum]NIK36345.1 galactokinase [Microbacterium endophyticum]